MSFRKSRYRCIHLIFYLLLQNYYQSNVNQNWHKSSLDKGNLSCVTWRALFQEKMVEKLRKKTHWRLLKYYSAEPLGQLQQKLAKRFIGRRVFKSVKKTAFFFRNKNKDLWNHFFLSCNSSSSIIIALLAQACLLLGTLYQASSWSLGLLFFCIFF